MYAVKEMSVSEALSDCLLFIGSVLLTRSAFALHLVLPDNQHNEESLMH